MVLLSIDLWLLFAPAAARVNGPPLTAHVGDALQKTSWSRSARTCGDRKAGEFSKGADMRPWPGFQS